MSAFVYIVTEGVQDVAFLGRLLQVFHRATRIRLMEELDEGHATWIKSFKWPLSHSKRIEIDRFSVPAPAFYRLPSGATVAFRSAEGITKIRDMLELDLESFARMSISATTVGIVLDSDKTPAERRLGELTEALGSVGLVAPKQWAIVSTDDPRVGIFTVPEPGLEGTLEDLLLQVAKDSYSELCASARAYADGWREKALAGLAGPDWKPIKKPAGGKKAAIAAMTAILKPGYAVQVSIEQNMWIREETKALPGLQPSLDFLDALIAPPVPEPTESAP